MSPRIANLLPAGYPPEAYSPSEELIGPGNSFEHVEIRVSVSTRNDADLMLKGIGTVDAVLRAEREGFDAALINTVLDYALRAAKSASRRMPVVGAGQAAMTLATSLGHRFSIVSIWPKSIAHLHRAQLRDYQLTEQCASIRHVADEAEMPTLDFENNFYARLRARQTDMLDRVAREIEAARREDGADVVVLGCTCMSPAAAALQERSEIPVVDPLLVGYLHAETLARLGVTNSADAFPAPSTARDTLFAGLTALAGDSLGTDNAPCDVCVWGADLNQEDAAGAPS